MAPLVRMCISLTVIFFTGTVWAESTSPTGVAQEHDERALEHFSAGRYAEALAAMEAAQSLLPASSRLYNMAVCHERLGHIRRAVELYQDFVDAPDAPHERQELAQTRLDRLRATLEVVESSETPTIMPPVATSDESQSQSSASEGPPVGQESETVEGSHRLSPALFYAFLGVTAAAAVTMAALGGLTLSEQDAWEQHFEDDDPDELLRLKERGQNLALATNVMLGITATGAAATLVIAFFTRWRRQTSARRTRYGPSLSFVATAVTISGRF